MSINNVLLFVSSTSSASIPSIKFVREYNLPVLIIRLDTIEDRQKASNGKFFKITEVPTLVISYNDGTLQLFVGSDKILNWMQNIIRQKEEPEQKMMTNEEDEEEEESFVDTVKKSKVEKKKTRKDKSSKKKKRPVRFEDEDMELLDKKSSGSSSTPTLDSKLLIGEKTMEAKNLSIYNIAKKMEQERSSSLGYKEEELPKYH